MNMASLRLPGAATIVMLTLSAIAAGASAQEIPAARIAVVDYQRLLRDSSAAIDIRAQVERRRKVYLEQITAREQELRVANDELTRQRTILSPEAFALKRREFEERVAEAQKFAQTRKRELDQAYDYGIRRVREAVAEIIAELAKERGFNLVFTRKQILYVEPALNISDEIILRLNERFPKVAVPLSEN